MENIILAILSKLRLIRDMVRKIFYTIFNFKRSIKPNDDPCEDNLEAAGFSQFDKEWIFKFDLVSEYLEDESPPPSVLCTPKSVSTDEISDIQHNDFSLYTEAQQNLKLSKSEPNFSLLKLYNNSVASNNRPLADFQKPIQVTSLANIAAERTANISIAADIEKSQRKLAELRAELADIRQKRMSKTILQENENVERKAGQLKSMECSKSISVSELMQKLVDDEANVTSCVSHLTKMFEKASGTKNNLDTLENKNCIEISKASFHSNPQSTSYPKHNISKRYTKKETGVNSSTGRQIPIMNTSVKKGYSSPKLPNTNKMGFRYSNQKSNNSGDCGFGVKEIIKPAASKKSKIPRIECTEADMLISFNQTYPVRNNRRRVSRIPRKCS